MSAVRAGQLLVATPELLDPNFADSVVLILDVDDSGSLGVVLNHPSPVPVGEVLVPWQDQVASPEVLFRGGPVGVDGALALGRLVDTADIPVGFRQVFSDVGLVDLDTPVALVEGSLSELRIFAGYAGWEAEQLVQEIAEGSWYVVPAEAEDAFLDDVSDLVRQVLRRQPGDLAWHSTRPSDASMN